MAGSSSAQQQGEQDEQPASLSQLCSICHTAPPKYTCPRCAAQTCSLPCTRRHKIWAQCSGIRDPAAYVKRKDLATDAAAFDRDFNFLTGVERAVERAGRVVENGWVEDPGLLSLSRDGVGNKKHEAFGKGEVPFLRGAEESGVVLVRAPKGMKRRRENESVWYKKQKCMNWSIEWVLPDGSREKCKSLAAYDVGTAFGRTSLGGRGIQDIGKGTGVDRPRKKRRVGIENGSATTADEAGLSTEDKNTKAPQVETQTRLTTTHENDGAASGKGDKGECAVYTRSRRGSSCTLTPGPEATLGLESRPKSTDHVQENRKSDNREYFFYLHRPRSRSKVPVLIPLSRSMILVDALRGRTVLEFPTVYVLERDLSVRDDNAGADEEGQYMLEEEYLAENPDERDGIKEEEKEEGEEEEDVGEELDADGNVAAGLEALTGVDESKLLQAMKEDLGEEKLLTAS